MDVFSFITGFMVGLFVIGSALYFISPNVQALEETIKIKKLQIELDKLSKKIKK